MFKLKKRQLYFFVPMTMMRTYNGGIWSLYENVESQYRLPHQCKLRYSISSNSFRNLIRHIKKEYILEKIENKLIAPDWNTNNTIWYFMRKK